MAKSSGYDWIVLGDHPGALLSGAMAARLGLSVLLLPEAARGLPREISDEVPRLDYETNSVLGLGHANGRPGLLRECLNRLELPDSEVDAIRETEPLPQIVGPHFRVHLGSAALEGVDRVLEREFGPRAASALGLTPSWETWGDELLKYWGGLPERFSLVISPTSSARRKGRLPPLRIEDVWKAVSPPRSREPLADPALREFMGGMWLGLAGSESSELDLPRLSHLTAIARSAASFRGGVPAFREVLLRLAKRHGAKVENSLVTEIVTENGYFSGVRLQSGEARAATGGVLGTGLHVGSAWNKRLRLATRPQGWKFTMLFEADPAAIPPGASPRLLWKEHGAPGLELEIVDPSDYALRRTGRKFIYARTVLPWSGESLSADYQRMVGARMRRQINEIFPFFDSHILGVFPDLVAPDYASRLAALYPFGSLGEVPEVLRSYSPEEPQGPRSGVEGLFLVTQVCYPQLGSLGPTVAAIESVSWLAHRSGLAGPLA